MIASLLASALLAAGEAPAATAPPAPVARGETLVLQAAEVHAGDGAVWKPGVVIVTDGKIVAAGPSLPLPAGARVIDCGAGILTPGLVDAACQLGTESLQGSAEQSSEVIPQLDVADSIDFFSKDFEQLLEGGVTTVYVTGEASSVISAKGAAVKCGGPLAERRLAPKPAVKLTLGAESSDRGSSNSPPSRFSARGPTFTTRRPTTRMGSAWVFRKAMHDALAFRDRGAKSDEGTDPAALRALADVLCGATALRIQARESLDFDNAIRLADEFGLKFTFEYATEAAQRIDSIVARKIPVIFGPLRQSDSNFEPYDGAFGALETPKLLAEKGVPFCLTASDASGDGGLARQAGLAIRNGLDRARALRAVTADPAAMVGLETRVGRIAVGLDADLVLWNGTPLDDTSKPVLVLINGRPVVDAESRFRKENS